ncbi:hypothetical protein Tco_0608142 [Tanacetum coccineum]
MPPKEQPLSQEDIEKLIDQRVANAIEAIAIYETKTRVACDSMDRVVCHGAKVTKDVGNKRKWEGDYGGSSNQKPNKRHKMIRAHDVGPSNRKEYVGTLPLCNKCKFHHIGPCVAKYGNCKRVGHQSRDCRTPVPITTQRPLVAKQKPEFPHRDEDMIGSNPQGSKDHGLGGGSEARILAE